VLFTQVESGSGYNPNAQERSIAIPNRSINPFNYADERFRHFLYSYPDRFHATFTLSYLI
jgi:hypothetical protein